MAVIGSAKGFAPGHITGFFEIKDEPIPLENKGSRGAGVCLSLGVMTEVHAEKGNGITVHLNGRSSIAPVTKRAVEYLLGNPKCRKLPCLEITIKSEIELPLSQGFGMSGAGALSTTIALAKVLNNGFDASIDYSDTVTAAHCAEVACRTGLGDVVAQSIGGWETRIKAGLPPYGLIKRLNFNQDNKIVLAVLGRSIKTKKILTDPKMRNAIILHGRDCVDEFIKKPRLKNFFELSNRFSKQTELADEHIENAIEDAQRFGHAAQSMLGNSVFATGKNDKITSLLKKHGRVWVCGIGKKARLFPY